MSDLDKLIRHRDDILRAEIAGWLHNLGKLEPNFLVQQTEDSPKILDLHRIPHARLNKSKKGGDIQYSYKCFFTKPTVLENPSSSQKIGVLYFIDIAMRMEYEQKYHQIGEQIEELQKQLNAKPPNGAELDQKLKRLKKDQSDIQEELDNIEKQQWEGYEREIEKLEFCYEIFSHWPLGSLLTLFWEDWFEKPKNNGSYAPGSEEDPDYHRYPKKSIVLKDGFSMDLPLLLLLAHGEISGQEKKGMDPEGQYIEKKKNKKGRLEGLRISTAFGYEEETPLVWKEWPQQRKEIIDRVLAYWNEPKKGWAALLDEFQHLRYALGDTQRPINEITLWDYSQAVAALFKTAVVQAVLTEKLPTPHNMRWRLASIRLNAFDFLFQANQLVDLLARQKLLQEFWKYVKTELEVETPISSAVYGDEHGLVVVIPEWPNKSDDEIRRFIESRIKGVVSNSNDKLIGATDLSPTVQIGSPQRGKKLFLTEVLPSNEPPNVPDPAVVQNYWLEHQNQERCYVCGLRPVGYIENGLPHFVTAGKARERNLCGFCLARRGRRAEEWAEQQEFKKTIWINEVADSNGRMALLTGRFDLDDWLSGRLVRSLAVGTKAVNTDQQNDSHWLAKAPTFARMQRVWRTTDEFWQDVIGKEYLGTLKNEPGRIRLYLEREPDLGAYHVYELDLGKAAMSVVWCPAHSGQGGFLISAENLGYIARQLGAEKKVYDDPAEAVKCVEDFLKKKFVIEKCKPVLLNPEGTRSDRANNPLADNHIVSMDRQDTAYSTAIPIFAEPRTFMALVPADKALEIMKAVKTKYEREMGKVRNRLPLHLGVVFAHRRTPLRAVLEAGRQMLKQKTLEEHETWTVKSVEKCAPTSAKAILVNGCAQFNCSVIVELERNGRSLTWCVPVKMGDGQTEDLWYPYIVWGRDANGETNPFKAGRQRTFQGPHDKVHDKDKAEASWLVHVTELKEGDRVYFTPATFDFEWLDTNARRFEIAYNDSGQRQSRLTRPYLLDDLDHLETLWDFMKNLTVTQRHQVIRTIESTREAWYGQHIFQSLGDDVFRQFVEDTLAGAVWPEEKGWEDIPTEWRKRLVDAGVRGELTDLSELHMEILKER